MENAFLTWALYYARKGWKVFPCLPRTKHPATEHGYLDATTDEAQIRAWWERWPNANVAMATGDPWALDIDPKNDGDASAAKLIAKHSDFARTLQQITGGGGSQRFYKKPADRAMKRQIGVWPGIDICGEGGYVMLPPSIHPDTGRRYEWDGASEYPEDDPIAEANQWLIQEILNASKNGHGPMGAVPKKIPYGTQHRRLVQEAGRLRGLGFEFEEIFSAIWVMNTNRCEKPGPRENIEKLCRDMADKPAGNRSTPRDEDVPPEHWSPAGSRRPGEVPEEPKAPVERPKRYSVGEVKVLDVVSPGILIESVFPKRGLCLFTGGQKTGKTVFAAQAAIAVASGVALFQNYEIRDKGPVLIIEVDDPGGDSSFKDLWTKWDVPDDTPAYLLLKAPFELGDDFIGWIEEEIADCSPRMVILDSYLALRPLRGKSADIVHKEKQEIRSLDELGKKLNVLIVLIHHESSTTKANALLGWDSRGAGTFAMTAAAESQLSITRFRDMDGSPVRLVRSLGRHMPEHQMVVRYDAELGLFKHIIDGLPSTHYPLLVEMRREIAGAEFGPQELQEALGISKQMAHRHLNALMYANAVVRDRSGVYRFTNDVVRYVG